MSKSHEKVAQKCCDSRQYLRFFKPQVKNALSVSHFPQKRKAERNYFDIFRSFGRKLSHAFVLHKRRIISALFPPVKWLSSQRRIYVVIVHPRPVVIPFFQASQTLRGTWLISFPALLIKGTDSSTFSTRMHEQNHQSRFESQKCGKQCHPIHSLFLIVNSHETGIFNFYRGSEAVQFYCWLVSIF